jgi:hypothetical protein
MAPFDPHRYSPAIHVNQEGYAVAAQEGDGRLLPGRHGRDGHSGLAGFALIDARTGETVYTGSLAPRRDIGYRRASPLPEGARGGFQRF